MGQIGRQLLSLLPLSKANPRDCPMHVYDIAGELFMTVVPLVLLAAPPGPLDPNEYVAQLMLAKIY
jgi:hypothetical protein